MTGVFYSCLITLVYIYIGYPMAVFLASRVLHRDVRKEPCEPVVTILIAAYNEEKHIMTTIENKLSLDYPHEKLEVIVVSDGSDDGTDDIVRSFCNMGVKLIRQEPRQGKTAALNLAVPEASGEVIVFSDANSIYEKDALRRLVENFADPEVGYVTGKMVYVNPDGTMIGDGCSAYMRYENFLRNCETGVGSVVGVDGGIDAVRRRLYCPMRADQLPDFVLPLMVVEQGFRVVYEPSALLREEALKSSSDEYRMRVRVSLRALWALWDMKKLFDPCRYGIFSMQLVSHKVLRYLGIVFLVFLYTANALLLRRSWLYNLTFFLQSLAILLAFSSLYREKRWRSAGILGIPYYFLLINIAAGRALVKFLQGEKQVTWTPRKG